MKRILCFFGLLLLCPSVTAIAGNVEQQGYVRTIGRPNNKSGKRLPNAIIRVRGVHNAVKSNQSGDFSILFNNAKVGVDGYYLSSVRLAGYEVNEKEVLGRKFAVSATVPHEIVMVSIKEKYEIEDRVRRQVEARYVEKIRQLEAEKDKLGKSYGEELQKLEALYEKREAMIKDMAERYAYKDYSKLDPTSAKINAFIEYGELERADSIIQLMNIAELEKEQKALGEIIKDDTKRLQAKEETKKKLSGLLTTAYNGKFEIHSAKFNNDSAAYYLEKIIQLDTTNVDNYLRLIEFIGNYLSDYDKMDYYSNKALSVCLKQYGEKHPQTIRCYLSLSVASSLKGDYKDAKRQLLRTLEMSKALTEEDDLLRGEIYYALGQLNLRLQIFDQAEDYYQKALSIFLNLKGEKSLEVAYVYSDMGSLYLTMGSFQKSVESIQKALNISIELLGEEHYFTSTCYHNLGYPLWQLKEMEYAKACFDKGLEICLKVLGENHPSVAISYNMLGVYYLYMGDLDKAETYYRKSLDINLQVYRIGNNALINNYNNLGAVYGKRGDYAKAMEYLQKSLDMALDVFGELHLTTFAAYSNMADYSMLAGDFVKSEECLSHQWRLASFFYGDVSEQLVNVYLSYARLFEMQQDPYRAKPYYSFALETIEQLEKSNPLLKGSVYERLSKCYGLMKNGEEEYSNMYKALTTYAEVLEKSDVKLAELFWEMARLSVEVKEDLDTAYSCLEAAYVIYSAKYGEEDARTVKVKNAMETIRQYISK